MRSLLTRHLYLPLAQRLKGHTAFRELAELQHTQWGSPQELERLQWSRLRDTLEHALHEVPYYRRWQLKAGEVRDWSDFQRLPLLPKADLREQFDALQGPRERGQSRAATSGSSGAPVSFEHSGLYSSRHLGGQWRARSWFGLSPGDATLALWGRPLRTRREAWTLRLKSFLNHVEHVSAFDMEPDRLTRLCRALPRFRPRLVYGYPTALELLCRHALSLGLPLDRLGVRLVACTAEPLHDFQRELLRASFGCPVVDVYGAAEFGAFAHECPLGRMHVAVENVVVEILDDSGRPVKSGTPGEVVVTGLANRCMPLIRYRLGDIAALTGQTCPCGRGLPLLEVKGGRLSEMIRTGSGRVFHSELFNYLGRELLSQGLVRQFQVVQTELDHFLVLLVACQPGLDLAPARASAQTLLGRALGGEVRLTFETVSELTRHPGGKLRLFESRL